LVNEEPLIGRRIVTESAESTSGHEDSDLEPAPTGVVFTDADASQMIADAETFVAEARRLI